MENKLPFPSLKHISMVHIGANILNQVKIAKVIFSDKKFHKWPMLKEKISGIVDNLHLSALLLTEQWNVIEHLCIQIYNLIDLYVSDINFHCESYVLHRNNGLNIFYFNVRGEINLKKMLGTCIEETFRDYDFDDSTECFTTACNWCLEDCISRLWNRMEEDARTEIVNNRILSSPVIAYWLDFIGVSTRSGELLTLYGKFYNPHILEDFMKYGMHKSNNYAVEYFWHKLPVCAKARNAYDCAEFASIQMMDNLLWSSLTHLSKEKLLEFLSKNSYTVSECFLQRPNNQLFFSTLDIMWDMLSRREYMSIFLLIVRKMVTSCSVDKFHCIIEEFWHRTPYKMKCILRSYKSNSDLRSKLMSMMRAWPEIREFIVRLDGFPFFIPNSQDN